MVRLPRAQEEARHQIVQLAGRGLLPEELSARILRALLLAVPADEAALFGVDPNSFLFNRLLAAIGNDLRNTIYWLQNVYLAREPGIELTFPGLMAANIRAVTLRDKLEACWGMPVTVTACFISSDFYHAYHDIGSPPGGGVRAWFELNGRKIAALQMARLDATHPIQASDGPFLHMMAPIIGQALGSAFLREKALTDPSSEPPGTGMFVLTNEGRIVLQTPAVEEWLRLLADSYHRRSSANSGIPVVVLSVMAALRANMHSGAISSALRVPTRYGMLRVEASPAGEGTIAVILVPERQHTPPQLPESWQITPRERRVLTLVTQGLTNQQISEALVISGNTVESHLSHAYEKLGVNSRTQFLARLFRETHWPMRYPD
jgi:DNA-binding CsgD family transcriptional regulator